MDGPREYCEMLDRERQILCVTTYTWNSENKQMNITKKGLPGGSVVKNPPANGGYVG